MPMSVNCPANPAVWFHLFANAFLFVGNGSAAQKKKFKRTGPCWRGLNRPDTTKMDSSSKTELIWKSCDKSFFFLPEFFFCLKAQIWLFLIFKAKLMPVERNYSMIIKIIFSFQLVAWVKRGHISDVIFSENALILVVIVS